MSYAKALRFVLQWEGGYVNDPADPGGATNCGITQAVYDAWRASAKQPKQPVRQITAGEVEAIYRAKYWDACRCGELPEPVDLAVFDSAVNCGVSRACKWLQEAAGVLVDGEIGPKTIAAVKAADATVIAGRVAALRDAHYARIVKANPRLAKFSKGWGNRLDSLKEVIA
jgi:lysozyme family protein